MASLVEGSRLPAGRVVELRGNVQPGPAATSERYFRVAAGYRAAAAAVSPKRPSNHATRCVGVFTSRGQVARHLPGDTGISSPGPKGPRRSKSWSSPTDAVDRVRRQEHRELLEQGDRSLVGTKYLWLQSTLRAGQTESFNELRRQSLKVSKAWRAKEVAMELWWKRSRAAITADWKAWCHWARRLGLEPVRRVAQMVATHLTGIVNAVHSGVTNALSESINAKIQMIKRMARGFRNRERFRCAIYFHLGGLDLYPASVRATHTNA